MLLPLYLPIQPVHVCLGGLLCSPVLIAVVVVTLVMLRRRAR